MEEWKDIAGYEGLYQVSNFGRVRSFDRVVIMENKFGKVYPHTIKGRVLRPGPAKSGHLSVSLNKNKIAKTHQVHVLVLEAFVGPRPGNSIDWHGCHKDGNPGNNYLENLRWDTRSGNEMDKVAHNRSNRGERNRAAKLSQREVCEIKELISDDIKSQTIADRYGVSRALINAIKRGRAWAHV